MHATATVNKGLGQAKLYLNGALNGTATFAANSAGMDTGDAAFGISSSMQASFDEARVSNAARSADWVKATYDNQKQSSTFVGYAAVTGPPIIASNLKDTATAKQAYTYDMKATGGPNGFAAFNLPGGLDMDPSTGKITGTPLRSGVAEISLMFSYADGTTLGSPISGDAAELILELTVEATNPVVDTKEPANVTATSAIANGKITDDGGASVLIDVYYGQTDGGATANSWTSALQTGNQEGEFSVTLANLEPGKQYYYRFMAFNAAAISGVWSDVSKTFTTTTSVTPVVGNKPVGNLSTDGTVFSAELQSDVVFIGDGTVGNGAPSHFTKDAFDGLMLWLDANDSSTISKNPETDAYVGPSVTRYNDLIGYWNFDETTGYAAVDTSGGGYNGKLLDGARFSTSTKKFGDSSLEIQTSKEQGSHADRARWGIPRGPAYRHLLHLGLVP